MKRTRALNLLLTLVIAIGMIGSAIMSVAAASNLSQVKGLKATMATNNAITIKWSGVKGAKKYEVRYKIESGKWKSKKTTKKTMKITELKSNKKYYFKVRAMNGSKVGKFSKAICQRTYIKPAAVKYGSIFASYRDRREIELKWKPVENASWYDIYALELNSDGPADIQNCDYEEYEENKYRPLPQYHTRVMMRQNTWYEFKIRSANAKTGKFPALYSAWTKPFYACTLKGNRVITGKEENGIRVYELNDTFVVGADDVLVPKKIYEREDVIDDYSEYWYESDVMYCNAVTFPEKDSSIYGYAEWSNIDDDEDIYGKTYTVGDQFEGYEIESIVVEPKIADDGSSEGLMVSLNMKDTGNYSVEFYW